MKIEELMSGVVVVIDDELSTELNLGGEMGEDIDLINRIVKWFETEWGLPFAKMTKLPTTKLREAMLQSASFVLLDWQLSKEGGSRLQQEITEKIKKFLISAKDYLVPVVILTHENLNDVEEKLEELPKDVYDKDNPNNNFILLVRKEEFWTDTVNIQKLEEWVYGNPSVYVLKTWYRVMNNAKSEFFKLMCQRSVNWPKVFWDTYKQDDVDPSSSMMQLINNNLQGRIRVDAFMDKYLDSKSIGGYSDKELRRIIGEASFRDKKMLPEGEVRCGDLYKKRGYYLLNLRPDCDCILRNEGEDIYVHCVKGKKISLNQLNKKFNDDYRNFNENISENIIFGIIGDGDSIMFNFKKLSVCKYSDVKSHRVGRLLHPYLTRVQQRYALYNQRQGIPPIPKEALGTQNGENSEADPKKN